MANLGYVQVTRICNQHCLFCSNPENQRTLAVAEAVRQASQLQESGYFGVILTGGEPTLHPDLGAIVRGIRELGVHVRMITNGQKTAEPGVLKELLDAGLEHLHLSVHSFRPEVQNYLTSNPESFTNLEKTFAEAGRLKLTCDVNTVICAQNADHLDETVKSIVGRFEFVRHFVWNNIDPKMNRVIENPHTVARLADLELSLSRAAGFLESSGRTYRIERLPLCYMAEFAQASTETRKIVKREERTVHFLDEKGEIRQTEFFHEKAPVCRYCRFDAICAGLYDLGGAYDPAELYAVFKDPEEVVRRIHEDS
jgi:MoaA/NifB/PqqE/SkfB family radical SAM enzyme